jgi:Protein of unknown function (DUF3016)
MLLPDPRLGKRPGAGRAPRPRRNPGRRPRAQSAFAAGHRNRLGVCSVVPHVTMKTKVLILTGLLATAGAGMAFAGAATTPPASRVAVVFVQPDQFTDCKRTSWGGTSTDLLNELQKFMQTTGDYYVPAGMHLAIKVTNVDLAGEFEPQLGPQFDDVRMVRAIYPPRIALNFVLTNAQGAVVSSGQRDLTDPAFQMRLAWPDDDYLHYEKGMLRDWFSAEFQHLKAS